jgi:hypothetical protein
MRAFALAAWTIVAAVLAAPAACNPAIHPEAKCQDACNRRAANKCSEGACERGCRFVLDRLIEREGDNVVSCVARSTGGCSDPVWAECAAKIGWLADGGPPAPKPPKEGFDEED